MGKVGSPYVYGAAGPSSFDCSGLVVWAFAQAGRPGLPHSTYSLITMGVEVPLAEAQVGDLVFTNNAGHMGIYVGGGSFVHAPRTGRDVTVEGLGNYTVVSVRRI
jgi:cell wall-associated NlpC family hydrolase